MFQQRKYREKRELAEGVNRSAKGGGNIHLRLFHSTKFEREQSIKSLKTKGGQADPHPPAKKKKKTSGKTR